MNYSIIRYNFGRLFIILSLLLCVPLIVSLIFKESFMFQYSYIVPILISITLGLLLGIKKPKNDYLGVKEGLSITSLVWIVYSLVGAIPFVLSKTLPSYIDAVFETMSGFTTTGSSVIIDVEIISKSILFYRSFTLLIGGMGVIVFALAILPASSNSGGNMLQVMKAETAGPKFGKLVSKISETARILYTIYLVMTLIFIILLSLGKMDLFDSILHIFGAAGTGGFSIKNTSLYYYNDLYSEIIIGIAMFMFGVNFNLYFLILIGRAKEVFENEELKAYVLILVISTVLIMMNIAYRYNDFFLLLRDSLFTTTSFITTTTFLIINYDNWPLFSRVILLFLMFVGGMAGSTAGGIKISRVLMLYKTAKAEIKYAMNPSRIQVIKYNGKELDSKTHRSVLNYFALYFIIFGILLVIVSLETPTFDSSFSSVLATFNNIGPGMADIGPTENFAWFSDHTKIVLTISMYLGRLEILPVLVFLNPKTWKIR